MRATFETTIREVERSLSAIQRKQIPFATAQAMNETAKGMIEDNRAHMAEAFDSPTRWTLNAFHFRRATKANLAVEIERKLPARGRHYLEVQAEGGKRPLSGWEKQIAQRAGYSGRVGYIVPTKHMKRNANGNVSRAAMQRVLSHIGAQGDAAANSSRDSRKKKGGVQYFTPPPGSKLPPGIYSRTGRNMPKRVFAFDVKAPSYEARFDFDKVMTASAARRFPEAFGVSLARALATAR